MGGKERNKLTLLGCLVTDVWWQMWWRGISVHLRLLLCVHQSFNHIEKRDRTRAALTQRRRHQRHSRDLQCTLITSRGRPIDGTAVRYKSQPASCQIDAICGTGPRYKSQIQQNLWPIMLIVVPPLHRCRCLCRSDKTTYKDGVAQWQDVGWLLTCFCWSGWRTVTICWGSFVRKQIDGRWWNLFSWGTH